MLLDPVSLSCWVSILLILLLKNLLNICCAFFINSKNNCLDNLEWVTCSENNYHAHKTGLTKGHTRKLIQYDLEMNQINKFDSIIEASNTLKICYSGIKAVLYNKQNTSGGFIFKYLE